MVVKAVRGRRRYIVFTVPPDAGRTEVLEALEELSAGIPDLRVITSFSGKAIIRCNPAEMGKVSATMRSRFPGSESLITSGTLRKIRDVYPELKVPRKRKNRLPETVCTSTFPFYNRSGMHSRKRIRSSNYATRTNGL